MRLLAQQRLAPWKKILIIWQMYAEMTAGRQKRLSKHFCTSRYLATLPEFRGLRVVPRPPCKYQTACLICLFGFDIYGFCICTPATLQRRLHIGRRSNAGGCLDFLKCFRFLPAVPPLIRLLGTPELQAARVCLPPCAQPISVVPVSQSRTEMHMDTR